MTGDQPLSQEEIEELRRPVPTPAGDPVGEPAPEPLPEDIEDLINELANAAEADAAGYFGSRSNLRREAKKDLVAALIRYRDAALSEARREIDDLRRAYGEAIRDRESWLAQVAALTTLLAKQEEAGRAAYEAGARQMRERAAESLSVRQQDVLTPELIQQRLEEGMNADRVRFRRWAEARDAATEAIAKAIRGLPLSPGEPTTEEGSK